MLGPILGLGVFVYLTGHFVGAVFGGGGGTRVKHGRKYKTVSGPCFRCDGTGQVRGQTCRKCGGSGTFSHTYWHD